jgi:hypothetical protein
MFQQIKDKVTSSEFKAVVKEVAFNVVTTVVVATAVKAATYIVVEGTKALINEIGKNKETPA